MNASGRAKGVSTVRLFGKFCIDFSSAQLYKTRHCVEPNHRNRFLKGDLYDQKILIVEP